MLIIPAPTSSYDVKPSVSIRGTVYKFTYRWNERSRRWKLDIESDDKSKVVYGLTLIEGIDLTSHLQTPPFDWGGFLMVSANRYTTETLGRYNFGTDKDYELLYIGYSEY